jgi:hypothetical protein
MSWLFGYGAKSKEEAGKNPEECTSSSTAAEARAKFVAQATGDLFKFYTSENESDCPSKFYLKQQNVVVAICKNEDGQGLSYMMKVFSPTEELILSQAVLPSMHLETHESTNSFVWDEVVADHQGRAMAQHWSIIFATNDEKPKFLFELRRAIFEATTQQPFVNVQEEDQSYVLAANDYGQSVDEALDPDVDFLAFDGLSIDETPQERRRRLESDMFYDAESGSEDDMVERITGATTKLEPRGEVNSLLVDSARHKKTFVVQGNSIGVFNRGHDDCMFDTEISNIQSLSGKAFTPSKMMLHNCDRQVVLLNNNDPKKMYPMDLETGKVVEEWTVDKHDAISVIHNAHSKKYGYEEETLVALAKNVAVGIDPRLSGSCKAIGNTQEYIQSKNPEFTCCATTAKGHLAVACAKGEIKLFTGVPGMPNPLNDKKTAPKTAKTVLPGFGDTVKALDITADGHWILATCASYLLMVNTQMPDENSTGFQDRLGKHKKRPRKLDLSPEDQLATGASKYTFTPASFNWGKGEMFIITSLGPYVIEWNFRRVQQGNLRAYTIKGTAANIISEQFLAVLPDEDGHEMPIVMAHPHDVTTMKRKSYGKDPSAPGLNLEFDRTEHRS